MSGDAAPRTWSEEDDIFMLMLCVQPERLEDPTRWCREMRELQTLESNIATVEDAEKVLEMAKRLATEAG